MGVERLSPYFRIPPRSIHVDNATTKKKGKIGRGK
jgi:hypothetical protein